MLDVSTMRPGDLYEDDQGRVWRVTGFWREPCVCMERVLDGDKSPAPGPRESMIGGHTCLNYSKFRRLVPDQEPAR